ncbi:MAG TPA: carboxypeptidase M32 [Rectinemataceae bacterium]
MDENIARLAALDKERTLLSHIGALLGWDQETYMPRAAVDERAEQLALIEGLAHEKAVAPEIGKILEELESQDSLDPLEKAYLRVCRREYDKETKLPSSLVTEMARATSLSQAAWAEARKNDDFASFAPHLERVLELNRQMAAALDPSAKAYDVLLDLYELGATEASISSVFAVMKADLLSVLDKIRGRPQVEDAFLRKKVSAAAQEKLNQRMIDVLGYDRERGRLDLTAHPFTTSLGKDDVRITTRFLEEYFPSGLFSTIHESGHALYELGLDLGPAYAGTRLSEAISTGIHESQSRMWENIIGRSKAFWKRLYPDLVSGTEGALEGVGLDEFIRSINKVEPSLIRTEADEVTYGLHVIVRFELESELVSGRLRVDDLPGAWDEAYKKLLGIKVPDDARGCLQDIHWSMGAFGYFPSYALGNLYAAQFWDAMKRDLPGLEKSIEEGDLSRPLGWLRKNIHSKGSAMSPAELVKDVTGETLDPKHFAAYLDGKYKTVYGY